MSEISIQSNRDLFYSNVWLFIDNAELILSNRDLFYTPVSDYIPIFAKKESFRYHILGAYVEWWLRYPYASRDTKGNPVVYFIGNPMTGTHSCVSISREGEKIKKCQLRTAWTTTMKTYYDVNKKYNEKKGQVKAMTFQEAIDYIKAHTTPDIRKQSKQRAELLGMKGEIEYLNKQLEAERKQSEAQRTTLVKCYVDSHRREIEYALEHISVSTILADRYREKTSPIIAHHRAEFKAGIITQKEFQKQTGKIICNQRKLDNDIHHCEWSIVWPLLHEYGVAASFYEIKSIFYGK